jgi:capsular polysaccharide biosynthesis protein
LAGKKGISRMKFNLDFITGIKFQDENKNSETCKIYYISNSYKYNIPKPDLVLGKEFLPDYGLSNIDSPIESKIDDDIIFEKTSVYLIGSRFVLFDEKYAVFNSFHDEGIREVYSHIETMVHKDNSGDYCVVIDDETKYYNGRYALIYCDGGVMFHHWLFQCLSRANFFINDIRFNDVKLLLPSGLPNFVHESLIFIGVPEEKIVIFDPFKICCFEQMLILPVLNTERNSCNPSILYNLRNKLLELVNKNNPKKTPDKVFFSRRDALKGERQLLNELEIINELSDLGFEEVQLGKISFEDQIKHAFQAEYIICVHGSGGANLIFCNENAKVLILCPDTLHYFLSHGVGVALSKAKFGYIFGPSFHRDSRAHNNPWLVSPSVIKNALREISLE